MPSSKKKQIVPDTLIKVGRQGATYQQKTYQATERVYGKTQEALEEYDEVIIDRSAAEIIDQINSRVKSPYYSLYCGIATLIFLFIFAPISIILAIVTFIVYRADVARKTTPLVYEFSDDYSEKKFDESINCFSNLAMTKNSWRLKLMVPISDWKRNAGAKESPIRHPSKIGKLNPSLLKTNVDVWGVDAGNIKLYLFPDRFFVFQDGVYSAIPYGEIQASLQDMEYREQEVLPSDATVIGNTWKYVRRNGEPDRRFNNNRQIPIVRYGVVVLSTQNFIAYLIVSSLKIASSFTQSFSRILASSVISTEPPPKLGRQLQVKLPEANLPPQHLEPLMKAASQGLELSTSQLVELLGLSSSFITKHPVSFDYEGFRFVRSGRLGRQISWKVKYIGKGV